MTLNSKSRQQVGPGKSVVGTGEANTNSNQGSGAELSLPKSGTDLPLRTLEAGANVTLTQKSNTIEIAAEPGTGEANTNSNQGSGAELSLPKSGTDLPLRTLEAGANVTLTQKSNTIEIAATSSGVSQGGIETFSSGSIDSGYNSNKTVWAIHCLALFTIEIQQMVCLITNLGSDNTWIGVYDNSLSLIATTDIIPAPSSTGFLKAPLVAPVTLTGGFDYWFAIKGDFGAMNWGAQNCFPQNELAKQYPYYPTPGLPPSLNDAPVVTADRCFWIAGLKP